MANPLESAITEKFGILKNSLLDDIDCIENTVNAMSLCFDTLNSKIEHLKSKSALHIVLPCFSGELKSLDMNISFLRGLLCSIRTIYDSLELGNKEFQNSLKEYFKNDKKLEKDDRLNRIRKSVLFNKNKALIEESVDLAVRSINSCVSQIKIEKMRLHVKYCGNLFYSENNDTPLWDNINVNAFMKLLEDDVGLDYSIDSSLEFKGRVEFRDWMFWKEGMLILFSDTLLVVPETLLDMADAKTTGGGVQYRLERITLKSKGERSMEIVKKNNGIFSFLLGIGNAVIKFENKKEKDDFIKYLKPSVYRSK